MKKFITIIVALVATIASHNARAQVSAIQLFEPTEFSVAANYPAPAEYKETLNSISVSYGLFSGVQAVYSFARVLGFLFTAGIAGFDNLKYSGCISIDYMHTISRVFDFGVVLSTDNIRGYQTVLNTATGEHEYCGTFNETYTCFMPQVRLNYIKRQHFALYGKAALGMCWNHSETRDKDGVDSTVRPDGISPAVHLTPVGCEAGGRNVRGFVELGAGWLGSLSLGARIRF